MYLSANSGLAYRLLGAEGRPNLFVGGSNTLNWRPSRAAWALELGFQVFLGLFCALSRMASSDLVLRALISRNTGLHSSSKACVFENSEEFWGRMIFYSNISWNMSGENIGCRYYPDKLGSGACRRPFRLQQPETIARVYLSENFRLFLQVSHTEAEPEKICRLSDPYRLRSSVWSLKHSPKAISRALQGRLSGPWTLKLSPENIFPALQGPSPGLCAPKEKLQAWAPGHPSLKPKPVAALCPVSTLKGAATPIEACASRRRCICLARAPLLAICIENLFVGKTFFCPEQLHTTKYLERTRWVYEGGQRVWERKKSSLENTVCYGEAYTEKCLWRFVWDYFSGVEVPNFMQWCSCSIPCKDQSPVPLPRASAHRPILAWLPTYS